MLAHSPPLPLTVDYRSEDDITAKDEEGILLALEQRSRVRHIRLLFPVPNLQKLIMAIDEEFPILEYLIVDPPKDDTSMLVLPETLQAPHLHHLTLAGFACPIRTRLHPISTGLVTLVLIINHQSIYFQPNVLLQWISYLPQLETLDVAFTFAVPNRDVERQLTHTSITTRITLPNLRRFWFQGVSVYLEEVLCRITIPRLKNLRTRLFKQLVYSDPQFVNTTENLEFDDDAVITLERRFIDVDMLFREADTVTCTFGVWVDWPRYHWRVYSVARISNALSQVCSAVEHLTLEPDEQDQSFREYNDFDWTLWRNLLRSFSNVKTLRVKDWLAEGLAQCLRSEDGESPLELFPALQELTYFGSRDIGHAFAPFIDTRQNAGRPVTLVRHTSPSQSPLSF